MLEYTYYWSLDGINRRKRPMQMIAVIVLGYREVRSMEHLRYKQCSRIPHQMFLRYKTYDVYNVVPKCCMLEDLEEDEETYQEMVRDGLDIPRRFEVSNAAPIRTHDFFERLGYNYKTKKFNGITMKRRIMNYMKEKGETIKNN